ncbi:MAG: hypothetical protein JW795_05690 [Chitinivibrionales bacterium]|nr:hypothetical protein [Chitinivibrionales bacterium]
MHTKLTIRLDECLIHHIKNYAKNAKKSISQLVAEYFHALEKGGKKSSELSKKKIGPKTSRLVGSLKNTTLSNDDYKKHLEEKYL